MHTDLIRHYDLLIDEGNDPVHDPAHLRAYMDNWDGPVFLKMLELDATKTVLEIGVGTGRLAIRTAPLCGAFYGIDLSPKTIRQAAENLSHLKNVHLLLGDFMDMATEQTFDVIYSSLTFMHIQDKQQAIEKAAALLNPGGRFVLSIDKNQDPVLDMGTRKITTFPDTPEAVRACIAAAGLEMTARAETEFAHLFAAAKPFPNNFQNPKNKY